ncbi:MAG TPA: hypothetical protein VMT34_18450, partial [Aggregatilineales bacterium]|nr:hypothetical protein [Aggregatilineales bacterium]
ERTRSMDEIKQRLIARQNEFITRQKLSELSKTVVPVSEIDDPLLADPPRLMNIDYKDGTLYLFFQRRVNDKWVHAFNTLGQYHSLESLFGKGPERFKVLGDNACINADEQDVQRIVDYFKAWLPAVNQHYKEILEHEKRTAEEMQRQELKAQKDEYERRLRILRNTKL